MTMNEINQDARHAAAVFKSTAVFGVGPGLGQAVARRYAREGYTVVLVARRQEPLDLLAKDLASAGATAHVITADLSDSDAVPALAEQIRAKVGKLDALYYAPTPSSGFVPAANLPPQYAQDFMPLSFYTVLALVQEFLPHMFEQGDGAILTAQGASSVQGLPYMSGPGPAQAAQRNYLQSLHAEVAEKGVYVGMLIQKLGRVTGKVLDIGSGNGVLAVELAQQNSQAEVMGIDYWGKDWEYSKEVCENNAKLGGIE